MRTEHSALAAWLICAIFKDKAEIITETKSNWTITGKVQRKKKKKRDSCKEWINRFKVLNIMKCINVWLMEGHDRELENQESHGKGEQ